MIENPLIEEFISYLQHEKRYSSSTTKCYATDLYQFRDYLLNNASEPVEMSETSDDFDVCSGEGGTGLAVLTTQSAVASTVQDALSKLLLNTTGDDVRRFLAFLRGRGNSEGTAARKLATLRTLFKFCLRRFYVRSNPLTLIKSPRREKHSPKLLKDDQIRRLLDAPDASTLLGTRDRAMMEAMLSTGIRASELVDLSIQDFDSAAQTLQICGNGKKQRIVPLPATTLARIQRYLDMRSIHPQSCASNADTLFVNIFGRRLSTRGIRRRLDKYLAAAGLDPTISPHKLRQSFAMRLLNSGVDLQSVQKRMGHLSASSTLAYAYALTRQLNDYPEAKSLSH